MFDRDRGFHRKFHVPEPRRLLFAQNGQTSHCCPGGRRDVYPIPDGVTRIGEAAFIDCNRLTSIEIPNSVTTIGASAFYDCVYLTKITIPENVISIGKNTFEYCRGLTIRTPQDSTAERYVQNVFAYR